MWQLFIVQVIFFFDEDFIKNFPIYLIISELKLYIPMSIKKKGFPFRIFMLLGPLELGYIKINLVDERCYNSPLVQWAHKHNAFNLNRN